MKAHNESTPKSSMNFILPTDYKKSLSIHSLYLSFCNKDFLNNTYCLVVLSGNIRKLLLTSQGMNLGLRRGYQTQLYHIAPNLPWLRLKYIICESDICRWNVCLTGLRYWHVYYKEQGKVLLLTKPFIQAQIKENINDLRHWLLRVKFTGDRWIPRSNCQ